jgi:hypothetical protein
MRKLFISLTLILAVAGGLYWFNSNIAAPASVAINETATEKQLSECQLYYRDVFSNAKEYATFDDYPATTTHIGPIATLDEDSHAVAKRFYSYHVAALEKGVTFAGKYTISDWAYTGLGQMFAVVDVETGEVYPFPYVVDWEFDFRPDSNLIVINPKDSVPAFDKLDETADVSCDVKWFDDMKTYYFVFENKEFRLLGPEDVSGLQASTWLNSEAM